MSYRASAFSAGSGRKSSLARWISLIAAAAVLLVWIGRATGQTAAPSPETSPAVSALGGCESLLERETLTDNWFGFGEKLTDAGIKAKLTATQVYQTNLHGGLSTHRHSGRYAGRYDLTVIFDLQKLMRIPGAKLYTRTRGGWSDGLDSTSVGSVVGNVDKVAPGYNPIYVSRIYYEQSLLDGRLLFRVGKMLLTDKFECSGRPGPFDGSPYANDEATQFLNGALKYNASIPFPPEGLGAAVHLMPVQWWYVAAAVADSQADKRETGFKTTFHGEDYFFRIYETGVVPMLPSPNGSMPGTYRMGTWVDGRRRSEHDGGHQRDSQGFYLGLDQMLWKEPNQDEKGSQGLGAFFRFGLADSDVYKFNRFWSGGVQYAGLIPTRDDDVLGVGCALGRLVEAAGYDKAYESVLEVYYNIKITPWLNVSPSVQYVWNPGGADGVGNACVVGCRVHMTF
jgi:porin